MPDPRLQDIPRLWTAGALVRRDSGNIPTGFAELDRAIGGWPAPGLIELLVDEWGIGEIELVIPMIRALLERHNETSADRRMVFWLNPPLDICATALVQDGLDPADHWVCRSLAAGDVMWASELALRSGACALVIAWLPRADMKQLRRIKLGALAGTQCVVFRSRSEAENSSPATLRLLLQPHASGLAISVIKLPGRRPRDLVINVDRRTVPLCDEAST